MRKVYRKMWRRYLIRNNPLTAGPLGHRTFVKRDGKLEPIVLPSRARGKNWMAYQKFLSELESGRITAREIFG